MKYLLIICCATDEEIFLYLSDKCPAYAALLCLRKNFLLNIPPLFSVSFFYYYFSLRRNDEQYAPKCYELAVVMKFRLEELALRAGKRYRTPENDREKKITNASRYHLPGG